MDVRHLGPLALALGLVTLAGPAVAHAGVAFDGYPAPQGASPLRLPLVPAFNQCIAPNGRYALDGGADGVAETAPNTLFAVEGAFVP